MATSINNSNTNIAAVSVLTKTNKDAITSINGVLGAGAFASAGTSATLQTKINAVSSTMATSIGNSNTNIAAVSVLTKTNKDAITSINAIAYASAGTSATLETRIATVSSTMATSIANVSATLESRIAAVSAAIPSVGIDKYYYTATNGQTTFSGADTEGNTLSYTGDNLTVTLNGLSLDGISDYTASNGTSIVLAAGATTSDEVNIVVFNGAAASGSLPSTGGTITGDLEVNGALTVDGNTVWHNGNDAVSFTQNGYQTLPNGLMIQWGQRNTTSQTGSISFPTTFTTACWMVQVTSNYTLDKFGSTVTGKSTSSFNYRVGGNYVNGTDLYWIAIGK